MNFHSKNDFQCNMTHHNLITKGQHIDKESGNDYGYRLVKYIINSMMSNKKREPHRFSKGRSFLSFSEA